MNSPNIPNGPRDRWLSREQTIGQKEKRAPARNFDLKAKDFTSTEQAVPIRVSYGTVEMAGIYVTPIFGFRSVAIKTEAGK